MIQRIQSVYLFIAAVVSGVLLFVFNLWTLKSGEKVMVLDLISNESILLKTIPLAYFGSAILSLIAIFLFKNRQLQFVFGRLNMLMNLYLLGVLIYVSQMVSGEMEVSEKGIGMFLPTIAVLLLVMANKAIKKDEDLVKSVDRLR